MREEASDHVGTLLGRAQAALGDRGELVGNDRTPRFELFHAAASICSQKVRCVLAQHGIPYVSHAMNMFLGETYLPDYVRLRMLGCRRLGGALAHHHSGSTSTEKGGCDGAVVPTLVDRRSADILVDSKRICLFLDVQAPEERRLRPTDAAPAIDEQLAIVDDLPNYQMLMGRTPGRDERPESRNDMLGAFSMRKVAWCDRHLRENAQDETLTRAYTAKRSKEASAADELFSSEAMNAAYGRADASLHDLERELARRTGVWLFGERLTMADLFWGIELLRMKDVGVSCFWRDGRLPLVEGFLTVVEALPAIRVSITDWPGARF